MSSSRTRRSLFPIDIALEVYRHGVLGFLEKLWRDRGDLAHLHLGFEHVFLVTHPEHVRRVGANRDGYYDKARSYDAQRKLVIGEGLVGARGPSWRHRRQRLSPCFSPRAIQAQLAAILDCVHDHEQRWNDLAAQGATVDVMPEMARLAGRVIGRFSFASTTEGEMSELETAFATMMHFAAYRQVLPFGLGALLPGPSARDHRRARRVVHDHVDGLIDARRRALAEAEAEGEGETNDLLGALLQMSDLDGNPLPDQTVRDEVKTFFVAGYETTAKTLAFCWHFLAAHPEVRARMDAEVHEVLGDGAPGYRDLKELRYTRAVIQETMRLCPPVPIYARDVVEAHELDGVAIPAGARMIVMPYITHRHPEVWGDPGVFRPERWLEAAPEKGEFHPFAFGERSCIGQHFAMVEATIIVSMLARRFELVHADPDYALQLTFGGTLGAKGGIPMRLSARPSLRPAHSGMAYAVGSR